MRDLALIFIQHCCSETRDRDDLVQSSHNTVAPNRVCARDRGNGRAENCELESYTLVEMQLS